MTQVTWETTPELAEQVRRAAASEGLSLDDYLSRLAQAAAGRQSISVEQGSQTIKDDVDLHYPEEHREIRAKLQRSWAARGYRPPTERATAGL